MVQAQNNQLLAVSNKAEEVEVLRRSPRSDWSEMSDADHFVQFYENDLFLLNSVGGFIEAGLQKGDTCIVVATRAHRDGLEALLQGYGVDLAEARISGRYIALEAAELLAEFMVDGSPDPVRFRVVLSDVLARAGEGCGHIRIFGEMVALLWADDNRSAAIRLEQLWNDFQQTHPFSLFCAYPMNGFSGQALAEPLVDVCGTHSRVIPAESYTELADSDARLRAVLRLQQKARSLEFEIAERKEAELALRAMLQERETLLTREQMARAEAEDANRLKDEFLATISHELRTPLNAIIGWSHLLRNERIDEATTSRAIETIERNARAQAQLVEDILDVSRVITGKLRLNIGLVDIASVINAAIDSVQLAAGSKNIQLAVILDPSARHVSGDPGRLQQVAWNLLSNAIKFTPAGGRVEVRVERDGASVKIAVSDTGVGIDLEFIPFVFDRFRQADGTSTRRNGGLGLGLAITRHLIELHGGTVQAQSQGKGCGATFTIKLPLAHGAESLKNRTGEAGMFRRPAGASSAEPAPSLAGLKVLLVDDDPDNLQILTVMLVGQRANVHTAASAAEAFKVIEWYKPDILVSDLAMPGEDGYSLIGKLRAREAGTGKSIPAIALTAYVRVDDRTRALTEGFNMFVPKPVEPIELINAIASLCGPGSRVQ